MRRQLGGVAAAVVLLALAGPAAADTGRITEPGNGTVFVGDGVVGLRATVDAPATGSTDLRLQGPTDSASTVVSTQSSPNGGSLSYDLDTACVTYPSSACRGHVPGVNGTWTVTLSGAVTDRRTFVLRIPPAAPDTVSASRGAGSTVQVSWRHGDEPDLTGWDVTDGSGSTLRAGVPLSACQSGMCSAQLDNPPTTAFRVRAYRSTCPGCGATLSSPLSATATVGAGPVGAPPGTSPTATPSPASPRPSATPSPSGSHKHLTPAQERAAQLAAFYRAFTPARPGVPTPAPTAGPRAAAADDPAFEEDGTYSPTLGYRARAGAAPQPAAAPASPARIADPGSPQMIALSLLLVLAGAHLQLWLRRRPR